MDLSVRRAIGGTSSLAKKPAVIQNNDVNKHLSGTKPDNFVVHPNASLLKVYFLGKLNVTEPEKLDKQIQNFIKWADEKAKTVKEDPSYYVPKIIKASQPEKGSQRNLENAQTLNLYKKTFQSFLWTGEECSDPVVKDPKTNKEVRWDHLALLNLYNQEERKKHTNTLKEIGIENVRLGIPYHRVNTDKDIQNFDKFLKDYKDAGIKISLDLQHFGLPDKFRNEKNPEKSYFLNPEWPNEFANFASKVIEKSGDKIDAITIVNEPFITNKFSGLFWNENASKKQSEYFRPFIDRALLIGKAAVNTRYKIEKHVQSQPDPEKARKVFVHNDSCEYDASGKNQDFNKHERFLNSDLILGQDWLLKDDFQKSDMFKWMEKVYVRPEHIEEDKQKLVNSLENIKNTHLKFQTEFNKTMKADTVFGIDYYVPCEHGYLSNNPEDYADEQRSGKRAGLYKIGLDYWNRYNLPLLHTETNMKEKDSVKWATQQLLELAQLKKSGVPVLGFNWYSLTDQYGWDVALRVAPKDAKQNDLGMINPKTYESRKITKELIYDFQKALNSK